MSEVWRQPNLNVTSCLWAFFSISREQLLQSPACGCFPGWYKKFSSVDPSPLRSLMESPQLLCSARRWEAWENLSSWLRFHRAGRMRTRSGCGKATPCFRCLGNKGCKQGCFTAQTGRDFWRWVSQLQEHSCKQGDGVKARIVTCSCLI